MSKLIRVLLVEDSEEDAELILRVLRRGGFEAEHRRVETASELEEALQQGLWDVVLSDYSMPAFDAVSAFRIVRDRAPNLPFIIVSGTIGEDVAVEAMRKGVQDYILKGSLGRLPSAVSRELRDAEIRHDRERTRSALLVEERRYRSIFNSAAVALWEVDLSGVWQWLVAQQLNDEAALLDVLEQDPESLRRIGSTAILDVNDSAVNLFGADARENLIGSIDHILLRGLSDMWRTTLLALIRSEPRVQLESTIRTFDGRLAHVVVSIQLPSRREDLRNVVVAMTDVTPMRELEGRLQAIQRMEAVGRLAGGIAHDFNNVLTVIRVYSEFVLEQLKDSNPARKDVENIDAAARRAAQLTDQLLAFSRKQVRKPEVLDLNETVRGIDGMVRRLIGEDIDVSTTLAGDLALVRADPSQLEQIVMNLVVNARDAMPRGGSLTIESANIELEADYGACKNVNVPPGRYVMLAISDTGAGMDEETRLRVFEPFFTTKPKGQGTGLGLSTVFGIVKQSGGYIWVYSEPSNGTTLKIYLPAIDDVAQPTSKLRASPTASDGGSEVILVVEDDAQVRESASRILRERGYRVLEAEDARAAITLARTHDSAIDLLLTDVVMPETSGPRLAQMLTPLQPTMKVAYMSGYTDNAIVHHGVLDEGAAYLQKPFSSTSLSGIVRATLDGKEVKE